MRLKLFWPRGNMNRAARTACCSTDKRAKCHQRTIGQPLLRSGHPNPRNQHRVPQEYSTSAIHAILDILERGLCLLVRSCLKQIMFLHCHEPFSPGYFVRPNVQCSTCILIARNPYRHIHATTVSFSGNILRTSFRVRKINCSIKQSFKSFIQCRHCD